MCTFPHQAFNPIVYQPDAHLGVFFFPDRLFQSATSSLLQSLTVALSQEVLLYI